MEHDTMLRDSSPKTQPSVFQFDAYPTQSSICAWDTGNQPTNYVNPAAHLQGSTMFANLLQNQVPPPIIPQVPSTFTFSDSTASSAFPFQITNNGFTDQGRTRLVLGKRKTDSPPPQPCKQHITEEKMVEHMSKLHISSETVTSLLEPESVKNKRLYMCEEMRKLQTEPVLPAALVSHIHRPCTALVLWQPPSRVLPILSTQAESFSTNKEEDADDAPSNSILESIDMDNEFSGSMDLDS